MIQKKEVLLGVTGSIAAYKACDIINGLKKRGCNVTVMMTKEACHFITPLTLQVLSGNRVVTEMFELPENYDPFHISLADKADLILIAPATANIIGKLACGICDDILTCTVSASRSPVFIVPAMNDRMYRHKSVQENIKRLTAIGYKFIGPKVGRLICGKEGIGHISDTKDIIKEVAKILKAR